MEKMKLSFHHEESVAANNLISLFIEVELENSKLDDILDIEGLFSSINNRGFQPLFTCSCGHFGCGGYHVKVSHSPNGIQLKNKYKPVMQPTEHDLLETFEYDLTWEDFYIVVSDVYEKLILIKEKYPDYDVCSGTFGPDLMRNIEAYRLLVKEVKGRCDS